MKLLHHYLLIPITYLCLSSVTLSEDKAKKQNPNILAPLQWKKVSQSIPLEGQYLVISKDAFFLNGKILTKKEFLKSINALKPIKGEKLLALHGMKGCSIEDFLAIRKELHTKGFLVCSSSGFVDLNEAYRHLAESNKPEKTTAKPVQQ